MLCWLKNELKTELQLSNELKLLKRLNELESKMNIQPDILVLKALKDLFCMLYPSVICCYFHLIFF